jgi:hypothetical protein
VAVAVALIGQVIAWRLGTMGMRSQQRSTEQQIRANIVSANRQVWINNLRDDLADLAASRKYAGIDIRKKEMLESGFTANQKKLLAHIEMLRERIRLRLNPAEADHKILVGLIDDFLDAEDGVSITNIGQEVTLQAQKVLKAEWERVKRGD